MEQVGRFGVAVHVDRPLHSMVYLMLVRILGRVFFVLLFLGSSVAFAEPVNAVVGDVSWELEHGEAPVEGESPEVDRIRTHLLYVADVLRARSDEELDATQRERRRQLLDALEDYARRGVFPRRSPGDGFVACLKLSLRVAFPGPWTSELPREDVGYVLDMPLPTPEQFVTRRLDDLDVANPVLGCFPHDDLSKTPKSVSVQVVANAQTSSVVVTTSPRSAGTEACLTRIVSNVFSAPKGAWDVDVEMTREVVPLAAKARLEPELEYSVVSAMDTCFDRYEAYEKASVKVRTKKGADGVSVRVRGLGAEHGACVEDTIKEVVEQMLWVSGGQGFLVRVDATTSLSFQMKHDELEEKVMERRRASY